MTWVTSSKTFEIHGISLLKLRTPPPFNNSNETRSKDWSLTFSLKRISPRDHSIIVLSLSRCNNPKTSSRFNSFIVVRSPEMDDRFETDVSPSCSILWWRFPRISKNSDKQPRRTRVPGIVNRFISVYSHLTGRFPEQRIWISSLLVAGNSRICSLETVNVRANGHGGKHREFSSWNERSSLFFCRRVTTRKVSLGDYILDTERGTLNRS